MSLEDLCMNLNISQDDHEFLKPPGLKRERAISSIDDFIVNEVIYQTPINNENTQLYPIHDAPKKNNKRKRNVFEENAPCKKKLEF